MIFSDIKYGNKEDAQKLADRCNNYIHNYQVLTTSRIYEFAGKPFDGKSFVFGEGSFFSVVVMEEGYAIGTDPLSDFDVKVAEETKTSQPSISDLVEHPAHYTEGRKYEPRKVIYDWGLNFNLGNAVKYLSRAGRKTGESAEKDLRKAIQYIQFELEEITKDVAEE